MSLFDDLTSLPSSVLAGQATTWTETLTDYPEPDYSVSYVFSAASTPVDGPQRFTLAGVGDGDEWTFTFAGTEKPGRYTYEKRITRTAGNRTAIADTGCLVIQPNLAVAQTETFAQQQVALLKTNLATLSASANVSVSYNGQSFTRGDTSKLQSMLAYWEGQVAKEQNAMISLGGTACAPSGRIRTRLSRYGGGYADTCGC